MKYFGIDIQSRYPEFVRISSATNAKEIPNVSVDFWKMNECEILINDPLCEVS